MQSCRGSWVSKGILDEHLHLLIDEELVCALARLHQELGVPTAHGWCDLLIRTESCQTTKSACVPLSMMAHLHGGRAKTACLEQLSR